MITMVRNTAKSLMVDRTYKEKTFVKSCFFTIIICMCRKTIFSPVKSEVYLYYTTPLNIIYFFLLLQNLSCLPAQYEVAEDKYFVQLFTHSKVVYCQRKNYFKQLHHLSLPSIPLEGLAITAILGTLGQ